MNVIAQCAEIWDLCAQETGERLRNRGGGPRGYLERDAAQSIRSRESWLVYYVPQACP